MRKSSLVNAVAGAGLIAGAFVASNAGAHERSAKATLATADGSVVGDVRFESEGGRTEVRVQLTATPGLDAFHGFHVHANDVAANGAGCIADPAAAASSWFVSADGHHNPGGKTHGHHAGDMPVVYVNGDGSVDARFALDAITPNDLDGKVVILHAGADNYANIPLGSGATQYTANSAEATAATGRTGNAGDRVACGVIVAR
jgi:superoxide dismutase, Cu-Zn family